MPPVVTITLNPALDLSADSPRVRPGPKLRLGPVTAEPGGGGINVARAMAALGGQALALACLGGPTGARLAGLLAEVPGLSLRTLPAPGDTRESLSVTEAGTGAQFRFVLPGPVFGPDALAELVDQIAAQVPPGAVVVLSGSQPPGLPDDLPARIARALPSDAQLIVDTSGPALTRLVLAPEPGAAPDILRMDAAEAQALAGHPLGQPQDSADLAAGWVARGVARCVIIARGAEGSVLVDTAQSLICAPPAVQVVSAVGAGDSFVAGLALALARGHALDAALTLGTAAAAAAVTTPGTELCRAADVARLAPLCRLSALPLTRPPEGPASSVSNA
jgi:6-phosphofructokinase 2